KNAVLPLRRPFLGCEFRLVALWRHLGARIIRGRLPQLLPGDPGYQIQRALDFFLVVHLSAQTLPLCRREPPTLVLLVSRREPPTLVGGELASASSKIRSQIFFSRALARVLP